jgi:hypothetical protein
MENTKKFIATQAPMTETGYLSIRVGTAGGALPVVGADVRIVGKDLENQGLIYLLTTDQSGKIQAVALPAPQKALSQNPDSAAESYSTYDVTVFKEGFYTQRIQALPIFSTITSTQFIELIPLSAFDPLKNPPTNELITVERTPFSKGEGF